MQALFTSKEAPEDSWQSGRRTVEAAVAGKAKALFVGITCGFSAPFVASQLEYSMDNSATITTVLLGFNPVSLCPPLHVHVPQLRLLYGLVQCGV
jgi:N-acetylmuramic acid 6-phosphate (MurNAc-6-P) etherase